MIVETSLGPLEKDLIEYRIVRATEHEGNRAEEVHYFFNDEPISINGAAYELNLFPRQLISGVIYGEIG